MVLDSISNKNLYKTSEFKTFETQMRQLLKQEIELIQKIYRLTIRDLEKQINHLENEKWRNVFAMKGEVRAKSNGEINSEIESLQNQIEIKEVERDLKIIEVSQRYEERIWITWVNFLAKG